MNSFLLFKLFLLTSQFGSLRNLGGVPKIVKILSEDESFIKVKECEEKVKHQLCSNIINTIAEICSHDDIITVSQVKAAARGPQQEPMTSLFHCYAANYHQDQLEQSPKLYSIKQNLFSSINNISVVNV